jgi:hypothetical protein
LPPFDYFREPLGGAIDDDLDLALVNATGIGIDRDQVPLCESIFTKLYGPPREIDPQATAAGNARLAELPRNNSGMGGAVPAGRKHTGCNGNSGNVGGADLVPDKNRRPAFFIGPPAGRFAIQRDRALGHTDSGRLTMA